MPQTAVKLIWSVSACNFCPRSDVRTCQIKPGKLLSKLSSALDVEESMLDHSEGICTCCLADIDMIIRAVAIRGAMKDYFMDMVQNLQRGYSSGYNSVVDKSYFNGHFHGKSATKLNDNCNDQASYSVNTPQEIEHAPPPPALVARPPFSKNPADMLVVSPEVAPPTIAPTPPKKSKERSTRYQCMLCDKIAGSKSHCMEHLICHSPVRPFTCSQCMKTYKSRKACREHLIVMHGVEKVEENLQRLVVVDHDGLKQLDHVCTQYRKIINQVPPKPVIEPMVSPSPLPLALPLPQFKIETEEHRPEIDGGSAWLYKPDVSPRLPPPLLQCVPSLGSPVSTLLTDKLGNFSSDVPPPSKRTRKGTPHKLVHDSVMEDSVAETVELDLDKNFNDDEDDNGNISSKSIKLEAATNLSSETDLDASSESHHETDLKRSYFPSFQTYKTEPLFPWMNRQSPPGGSRKALPPCEICGRCFPTKEKMADHMRSHSEVKQFSCLICNKYFKYRRGVTNHLKEVHHLSDRVEISSNVSSHEVGCVIKKYSRSKDRKVNSGLCKFIDNEAGNSTDTSISQKVIQDTLSSLAEIQHAADSTPAMPVLSSDESLTEADSMPMSTRAQYFSHIDNPTPDNSVMSVEAENSSTDENMITDDSKIGNVDNSAVDMLEGHNHTVMKILAGSDKAPAFTV